MENAHWNKVKDLLDEALEQPPDKLEAFLRVECGNDRSLLDEVLSLLHQQGLDEGFFEAGAVGGAPI